MAFEKTAIRCDNGLECTISKLVNWTQINLLLFESVGVRIGLFY